MPYMSIASIDAHRLKQSLFGLPDSERLALYLRLGMTIAMLSVVFETIATLPYFWSTGAWNVVFAISAFVVATVVSPFESTSRLAVILFGFGTAAYLYTIWPSFKNHGWLTVWTIPIAAAFGHAWWKSETYRWYLRATLGVVMLAACAQKLLAGTYWDGSYITHLSLNGSTTEHMFGFLCGPDQGQAPCGWHRFVGTFIMVWQAVVGILLLLGVRNLIFLFVEIGFLMGAGLYADEMNFQTLNIALLTIGFGYGMLPWICMLCLILLVLDTFRLSSIADHVFF